mgnify:CR=1 FL=1
MTIAKYISDLLYRYDCVIVPNFGGFVTNKIGAKANHNTHNFYPPTKQISFNSHLKQNDGLLVNYIASVENISFENAIEKIEKEVINWQKTLANKTLVFDTIGSLSYNKDNQLIFEPNTNHNFLKSSFGLHTFHSGAVKRLEQKVIPIATKKEKSIIPTIAKYAATAAILLTLGVVGYNGYQKKEQEKFYAKQQKALDKKIQNATFVISNPLPTIELNVTKEAPKMFHLIAGAFEFPENAATKVRQLKEKGFDAKILGINKWGLTQVTFNSFHTREKAVLELSKIKKEISKDAWLLIKKPNK